MKSAVNKPEVKTNNSSEENDRAEVKCSSSEVRAAASVQWENDKLHTTQKQACAAGSTGTETDRGGCVAEEKHADCEREIRETSSDEEEERDENDEDQGPESQVQDITDEANGISKHDTYSDEVDEFSKSVVEEMMRGTEQNEDKTKYESAESESEKHAPNNKTELKATTVADETLEDTLLSDPEPHTSENTPESGTGSDLIVSEIPGESTDWGGFEEIQTKLHDPAERDSETKHDTEARIQTELSLKEHVESRTELIVETKISSEDEEASLVSSQPHQLLEFTEGRSTLDAFSATSEITGSAEDRPDVKPVSTRSSSLAELLEEPVDLQADVAKTALEYVEEITNQVLKDMIEAECNLVQKTEPLVEAPAEHQAPASVLEEERWTMDSSEEHISSAECESTDGRHEQMQKPIAGESLEDLMDVSRPGMKRGFDQMSEGLPEVKTGGQFELILQVM